MRIFLLLLAVICCTAGHAQNIPWKYQDHKWAQSNANIDIFINQGIGSPLKGGLDAVYVEENLKIREYPFHAYSAMLIETFELIDFDEEANQSKFVLEFESGEKANFIEVALYLGDKYSEYFAGPALKYWFPKNKMDSIKEHYQLPQSKKIILNQNWIYDYETHEMRSFIRGVGLVPANSKDNKHVAWIDMRYFEEDILERIKVKVADLDSAIALDDYLGTQPYVVSNYQRGSTQYPDQTSPDQYNNEIDVYFELRNLSNQWQKDRPKAKIKAGKPVKTKQLRGELIEGKMHGNWTIKYPNGKLRARFDMESGIANGKYELFDDLGRLMESGMLRNNRKHDSIKTYFETGKLKAIKTYQDGFAEGTHFLYYPSGAVHSSIEHKGGKVHGPYKNFYADGSIRLQGAFKDDLIYGDWLYSLLLNEVMCGYMVDELPTLEGVTGITQNSMDDCKATFRYNFMHKTDGYCQGKVCVVPRRLGDIE